MVQEKNCLAGLQGRSAAVLGLQPIGRPCEEREPPRATAEGVGRQHSLRHGHGAAVHSGLSCTCSGRQGPALCMLSWQEASRLWGCVAAHIALEAGACHVSVSTDSGPELSWKQAAQIIPK